MTDARPFTILITGANQGLGLECVRILAQRPNLHIYVGARSEEKASGAIESLRPATHASTKLEAIVIEMTSDDSIEAAAKRVPILDVLVNNAGVVGEYWFVSSSKRQEEVAIVFLILFRASTCSSGGVNRVCSGK